jgi:endonuclease/exonuclease/phosphatase (EEP) superfamily protein YafD
VALESAAAIVPAHVIQTWRYRPEGGNRHFLETPHREDGIFSMLSATRSVASGRRPGHALLESLHKCVLTTHLHGTGITIMNVHLNPNKDGDWSRANQFYPLHEAQLDDLTEFADQARFANATVMASGDFNLAKVCDLYSRFMAQGAGRMSLRVTSPRPSMLSS